MLDLRIVKGRGNCSFPSSFLDIVRSTESFLRPVTLILGNAEALESGEVSMDDPGLKAEKSRVMHATISAWNACKQLMMYVIMGIDKPGSIFACYNFRALKYSN